MPTRNQTARIVAALALTLLPACTASATDKGLRRPYIAYRPAAPAPPPVRPLFLGGYAGYNYGPRANVVVTPTGAVVETSRHGRQKHHGRWGR